MKYRLRPRSRNFAAVSHLNRAAAAPGPASAAWNKFVQELYILNAS